MKRPGTISPVAVRLVLFDLDGTLIDSLPDLRQSLNYVRYAFRLPPLSAEMVQSFVGDGAWKLVERSLQGYSPEEVQTGFTLFRSHYLEHCTDFTTLYPECRETLAALSTRGKILGVVTNKPDRMTVRILEAFRLTPFISIIVGGDKAPERKPSPLHLRQALEEAVCRPDETLMIGDSTNDIDAAQRAGVYSCGVCYGFSQAVASDGSRPDYCIDRLKELLSILT